MPQLARTRDDPVAFHRETERIGGRTVLIVTLMGIGFAVLAPFVAPLLYGPRFRQPAELFALLAVFHTNRVLRIWPTAIAISLGRSMIVTANNAVRILAWPAALIAASVFKTLDSVVWAFIGGEVLAMAVALVLLARTGSLTIRDEFSRSGIYLLVSACMLGWSWALSHGQLMALWLLLPASFATGFLLLRRERIAIVEGYAWLRAYLRRPNTGQLTPPAS